MAEATHTPEPWLIVTTPDGNGTRTTIETECGNFIALTGDTDAPLIAASPNLLAACKLALHTAEYYAKRTSGGKRLAWKQLAQSLRRAVEKAEPSNA